MARRRDQRAKKRGLGAGAGRAKDAATGERGAVDQGAACDALLRDIGFAADAYMADETAAVSALLAGPMGAAAAAGGAERAAAGAEEQLRHHLTVIVPDPPIACGEGCAFCCYLRADVTAAEIARIVLHLRATRSPAEVQLVAQRARETAARVGGFDADARAEARVPCTLLEDGRCSVYEVRPLVCRGCNSASADDCEAALGDGSVDTTVYAPQKALFHYAGTALLRALRGRRLPSDLVELNAGLARGLSSEDALEAWLAAC